MSGIEKTHGLKEYLEAELHAVEFSHQLHRTEFELFCELGELYERVGTVSTIKPQEAARLASPIKLFQVVTSQMYGVCSQLLRRRIQDADALTRRAIEATAIAYRLWKHPEMCDTYENAYPNHQKEGHRAQWKPSFNYNDAFKLDKLFGEPEEVWTYLRSVHDAASAASTHSGPLATAFHVEKDGAIQLDFIESDNAIVRVTWNRMLAVYSEMLMVFFRILHDSGDVVVMKTYEHDLREWRTKAATITKARNQDLSGSGPSI